MVCFRTFATALLLILSSTYGYAQTMQASFAASDSAGCAPLTVTFSNQSTGNPISIEWIIEGVSVFNDNAPAHIFSDPGCYDITLIASDGTTSDTTTESCFIEVYDQPVPSFALSTDNGCAPLSVQITDNTIPNAAGISDWTWEVNNTFYNTQNPSVVLDSAGTYGIRLVVTNTNGCLEFIDVQDTIQVFDSPEAGFSMNDSAACSAPFTISLSNTTTAQGLNNLTYTWLFPGGNPDTATGFVPPAVTYTNEGSFDISLTVTADNGCSDTYTQANAVTIGGVTADFSMDTLVCVGDNVAFQNLSVGGASMFEWDFDCTNGGTTDATDQNPSFAFATAGTFCVELRAINPAGCSDTVQRTITVLAAPQAAFILDDDVLCTLPATVTATDVSVGGTSRNWGLTLGTPSSFSDSIIAVNYTGGGIKPICLTVTNGDGCVSTFCDTVIIETPVMDFTADTLEGCTPLPVQFTDNSSAIDPITSWAWSFDPASGASPSTSTQQNPQITFTEDTTYTVTLAIMTNSGCADTLIRTDYIRAGTPPTVDFVVDDSTPCVRAPVQFDSQFEDPDWEYAWDFMYDGVTLNQMSSQADPTFAYPDTGTYSVALEITNNGCSVLFVRTDYIEVQPPRAQFAIDNSIQCTNPATFTFTDESADAHTWEWYFDGTLFDTTAAPAPFTFSANQPGTFPVKLIVTNTLTGCIDSTTSQVSIGEPLAAFSTTDTFGCRPYEVNFTNASQDATSFLWWFEGTPSGVTGTGADPSHVYGTNGVYTVGLIAQDGFGCTDTLIQQQYIEVVGPTANFVTADTAGCIPHPVSFSDASIPYNNIPITAWNWNFGDAASSSNTSSLQDPNHTYDNPGRYGVTLSVQDSMGCSDTLTLADIIYVTHPSPDFAVDDSSTCPGNTLSFTNLSEGAGLTYSWSFGEGGSSTQVDPTHSFASPGYYSITLTATDFHNCVDSITKIDFIEVDSFAADFSGDNLFSICPPLPVSFTDASVPAANIVGWQWNFGDGGQIVTQQNPDHIYLDPDSFDVSLIVEHEDGCRDTAVKDNYVIVSGPNGSFSFSPTEACPGDTITFRLVAERASEFELEYSLIEPDLDIVPADPTTGDTLIIKHVYYMPGEHCPKVVAADNQACRIELPSMGCITIKEPPTARFDFGTGSGCVPFNPTINELSSAGDTNIIAWNWNFGDGATATAQNPVYVYPNPGTYTLELMVEDANGCRDTSQLTTVAHGLPSADLAVSDTLNCAPFGVTFDDLSTGDAPIVAWNWDFGDGNTGSTENPAHTYQQDGLYSVSLLVTDANGCVDSIEYLDLIRLRHPQASFEGDSLFGCHPFPISLFSTSQSDTSFMAYEWCLFNSGTQVNCSNGAVDSIDYLLNDPGIYDVQLIATDALGCSDTAFVAGYVEVQETVIPPNIEIYSVSVLDDNSLHLQFENYPLNDFKAYHIYRMDNGGNYVQVATISNQSTTEFIDQDAALDCSQNSYCYRVVSENLCDAVSPLEQAQTHCSIELSTMAGIDQITLMWTPYMGWGQVQAYEVYRANSYDTNAVSLIATVAGNTLSFTDTNTFCREQINYRIRAIEQGGNGHVSYSDTSGTSPIHLEPTETAHMVTATVVADSYIELQWGDYPGYKPQTYLLYRSADAGGTWEEIGQFPATERTAEDYDVLVDTFSYAYRVQVVDSCGDVSPFGRVGKSILLEAYLPAGENAPRLSWTPYLNWERGVARYEIEVLNDATGQFEQVGMVQGDATSFVDNETKFDQPFYCYRVRAYELFGNEAVSLSNEDCAVFRPALYTANAFTPNADGINDVFTIGGPNLQEVTITIFDRWGKEVFQSFSLDVGWDGKFKGRACPEGVYVFQVNGTGYNGTKVNRTGTVTLIR